MFEIENLNAGPFGDLDNHINKSDSLCDLPSKYKN
jgi:hypothetical protein